MGTAVPVQSAKVTYEPVRPPSPAAPDPADLHPRVAWWDGVRFFDAHRRRYVAIQQPLWITGDTHSETYGKILAAQARRVYRAGEPPQAMTWLERVWSRDGDPYQRRVDWPLLVWKGRSFRCDGRLLAVGYVRIEDRPIASDVAVVRCVSCGYESWSDGFVSAAYDTDPTTGLPRQAKRVGCRRCRSRHLRQVGRDRLDRGQRAIDIRVAWAERQPEEVDDTR